MPAFAFRNLLPTLCIASILWTATTATAKLTAERMTETNFATHHVGGPDSDAGIGDWFLSNGTICAAISDPEHESPIAPKGGVLIDLGHCGRDDDQWAVLQPMLNLSQSHVVPVTELEAGTTAGEAWIRTRATFVGVEFRTTYSLSLSEPNALRVHTEAQRIEEGDALFSLGAIVLHASGQTRPFALLRRSPDESLGFRYPASDRHSLLSMLGALVASDVNILVGSEAGPPISYGIEQLGANITYDQQDSYALQTFAVTGLHFTTFNAPSRPPWFGTAFDAPGLIDLVRMPFVDLDPRTTVENELRIWVGDRADVASITDQLWAKAPRVRGQIDDPEARVHIETETGAPWTMVRPDATGRYELSLPIGNYHVRARAPADREVSIPIRVEAQAKGDGPQILPPIRLDTPGWVTLPETFIGRLIFIDTQNHRPLVFGDDLLGFRIGDDAIPSADEAPHLNLAGVPEDPRRLAIPAGEYRVIAVRGPEYAISERSIEVKAGRETKLAMAPLERVATTPGWIAADLHVHSGESFDSGLPPTRQLAAFAASGAEVLVAAEHDRIVDPQIALDASGLANGIVAINGVEITSAFTGGDSPFSTGHWNAFPVAFQPRAYRGGAPTLEGRRAHDAIADIRSLAGRPFLQLNHPRPGLNEGEGDTFFAHMGVAGVPYDPTLPLSRDPNRVLSEKGSAHGFRDIDYDGVELLNGPDLLRYRRVRADWFSLLLQGESRVATSNSDSHRLGVIVGLPRTYVQLLRGPADPAGGSEGLDAARFEANAFDQAAFMKALVEGRAFGSTGPFLTVHLGRAGLGEIHSGAQGLLEVRVEAASWIPIEEGRIYVNGELVHRAPISAGETLRLPLAFARDAFVTVEVEGPAKGIYAEALPGFVPFAFTNPIFVDVDGNGRFDAPGLPDPLPPTLTQPDIED